MGYILTFSAGAIFGLFIMCMLILSGECSKEEEKLMQNIEQPETGNISNDHITSEDE